MASDLIRLVTILVVFASAGGHAQEITPSDEPPAPPPPSWTKEGVEQTDPFAIDIPCADLADEPTRTACWTALKRRFEYYTEAMNHRTDVFNWQHLSTRIIFFVVLLVVAVGLWFSYLQFQLYLRVLKDSRGDASGKQTLDTDLEFSQKGVKVSSNVLGVIILSLSLAFFYLYLAFVFPIRDTF